MIYAVTCRETKKRRVIFVGDNGAVKVNCVWSSKLNCTLNKNRVLLPLFFGTDPQSCALYVKTEADAQLVKSKLMELF